MINEHLTSFHCAVALSGPGCCPPVLKSINQVFLFSDEEEPGGVQPAQRHQVHEEVPLAQQPGEVALLRDGGSNCTAQSHLTYLCPPQPLASSRSDELLFRVFAQIFILSDFLLVISTLRGFLK